MYRIQPLILGFLIAAITASVMTPARAEYDYHHASACQGDYVDTIAGVIVNSTPKSIIEVICPIPRIYPRNARNLTHVAVHLDNSRHPALGRTVAVCAKPYWKGIYYKECVTKTAIDGWQEIGFDTEDLEPIRSINFPAWATYLYITVDQAYLDRMYGFRVDWDID